jgi:hypothetical protein
VGCFSVLKRLYGAAVKNQIQDQFYHVDKQAFLQILVLIRQKTYTEQNIKGGFSHAGIVPFDPKKVLSQLQIVVDEPTPVSSQPSTSTSITWSPKTPHNAHTLECQARSVKKLLNITDLNPNKPSSQALNQLIKGSLLTMHNAAILTKENHDLRSTINQLQKRRTRHTRALQNKGILIVSESRALAQALDQAVDPPWWQIKNHLYKPPSAHPLGIAIVGR